MTNPERKLVKQLTRLVTMASLERSDRAMNPTDVPEEEDCASLREKKGSRLIAGIHSVAPLGIRLLPSLAAAHGPLLPTQQQGAPTWHRGEAVPWHTGKPG